MVQKKYKKEAKNIQIQQEIQQTQKQMKRIIAQQQIVQVQQLKR